MKAFILAGGLGTRLREIVNDKPKPMALIAGKPFLEYQVRLLKNYGITELVFGVGYLHEQIQDYFGNGEAWDVKIEYSIEQEPLGTGGALKLAQAHLTAPFLVLNGDTYFDVNLAQLIRFHENAKSSGVDCFGTLALTEIEDARSYGSVQIGAGQEILSFLEKSASAEAAAFINAGIYVLEPKILDYIPVSTKVSLERETFPSFLTRGQTLLGYQTKGYFVDIGTPEGYRRFQNFIVEAGL